ncbi:cysteine ase, partial [Paramuricea clavata]
ARRRLDNKRIDYAKLQELILKAPHENLPLTLKENGFYFSIAKNYFNKDTPTTKEVKKIYNVWSKNFGNVRVNVQQNKEQEMQGCEEDKHEMTEDIPLSPSSIVSEATEIPKRTTRPKKKVISPRNVCNLRSVRKVIKDIHAMSSFLLPKLRSNRNLPGRSSVKRWTKNVDLCKKDFVFVPVFDLKSVTIDGEVNVGIINSLRGYDVDSTSVLQILRTWMQEELRGTLSNAMYSQLSWKHTQFDVPQQDNLNDCGVFICASAWSLSKGTDRFHFTQEDIPNIRHWMKSLLQIDNDLKAIDEKLIPADTNNKADNESRLVQSDEASSEEDGTADHVFWNDRKNELPTFIKELWPKLLQFSLTRKTPTQEFQKWDWILEDHSQYIHTFGKSLLRRQFFKYADIPDKVVELITKTLFSIVRPRTERNPRDPRNVVRSQYKFVYKLQLWSHATSQDKDSYIYNVLLPETIANILIKYKNITRKDAISMIIKQRL